MTDKDERDKRLEKALLELYWPNSELPKDIRSLLADYRALEASEGVLMAKLETMKERAERAEAELAEAKKQVEIFRCEPVVPAHQVEASEKALRAKMIGYEQEADRLTCENVDLRAELDRLREVAEAVLVAHVAYGDAPSRDTQAKAVETLVALRRALASGEESR